MTKNILFLSFSLLFVLPIIAQTHFTHVDCGTEFTVAVRSDSTLWAWGFNGNGQLGLPSIADTNVPVQVAATRKWIFATTGAFHTFAISTDSTLWGCGFNQEGNLGKGSNETSVLNLTQISATSHWRTITGGYVHSAAIRNDGTLWTTGWNMYGQLGLGDTTTRIIFSQVDTSHTWKLASAGGIMTYAIKNDGTLWGWGYNGDGELGSGNTISQSKPTQIGSANNWVAVSAGFQFGIALKADGTIWSWGFNGNGQLGRSTSGMLDSVVTQIGSANNWKTIAAGSGFAFAIKSDSTLWGWGYNGQGQLGISISTTISTPTQIGTDNDWKYISGADGAIVSGSVYGLHSAGFKTAAKGICTAGADYEGQLGNGFTSSSPQAYFDCSVAELVGVASIPNNPAQIVIYPNPASDLAYVEIPGVSNERVSMVIAAVNGKICMEQEATTGAKTEINIKSLAPGSYFVSINKGQGIVYHALLIKQ